VSREGGVVTAGWPRALCVLALTGSCRCAYDATPSRPEAPAAPVADVDASGDLVPVALHDLVVTSGSVRPHGAGLEVVGATTRAVIGTAPRDGVEASFVYEGPSAADAPLASGELRRQIGLKLRARDTCNVVYVMWHIEPTTGIHVAVKTSPSMTRHEECGDRGYVPVAPTSWRRDLPAIRPGERRTLRATIDGRTLAVSVDGIPAWTGQLPPEAFAFDGPAGVRADNGTFLVDLRASAIRK
jgi:hypothetical protein